MSENERPALVRRSSSFGRYGGGGEKCALCAKTVYVAERAVAQDKIFHVACFRCKECNVKLTLSSWCMDPCGGLWCKPHFMQALKTSGGTLTVNTESERSPPSTPRRSDSSNGKAAATPQRPLAPATAHGETRSPAHVPSPAPTPAPSPVCTPVPAPATASPAPRSGSKIMRSSSFGRFGGGGEKCTRCNKTVYAAERVSAKDQVFHNTCFRCIECNIKLSPSNWRGRPPTREHVPTAREHAPPPPPRIAWTALPACGSRPSPRPVLSLPSPLPASLCRAAGAWTCPAESTASPTSCRPCAPEEASTTLGRGAHPRASSPRRQPQSQQPQSQQHRRQRGLPREMARPRAPRRAPGRRRQPPRAPRRRTARRSRRRRCTAGRDLSCDLLQPAPSLPIGGVLSKPVGRLVADEAVAQVAPLARPLEGL